MADDRTEQATPQRKQKAREQGDQVHSRDLVQAAGMLAGVLTLGMVAPRWVGSWASAYTEFLGLGGAAHWEPAAMAQTLTGLRMTALAVLAPLGLVFAAVGAGTVAAGVVQGGGLTVRPQALAWKWERVSPASNAKNIFSMRGVTRLARSLLPAAVLGVVAWRRIAVESAMPALSLTRLGAMFGDAYGLLVDAAWILFAWSLIDYAMEWRSWTARLRMSKQEMREEFKEQEGNPQVRGRIRGLQRQMRRRKLKGDVKRATVVVTNPTHYAVALSFDFETMEPPRVLAKGRNLLAEEIKCEARWAGVPIVENPPLARSLYRTVEAGQPIPADLYAAVAAILAYLYRREVEERIRRQKREAGEAAARAAAVAGNGSSPMREAPGTAPLTNIPDGKNGDQE